RPEGVQRTPRQRPVPRPVMTRVATPPPLKPRPAKEELKPQQPVAQKPIARPSPEMVRGGAANMQALLDRAGTGGAARPAEWEEEEAGAGAKGKVRPGGVAGRDKR